jgi:uncharacterized protein (DUF58 family)
VKLFKDIFPSNRLYAIAGGLVFLLIIGYGFPAIAEVAKLAVVATGGVCVLETLILFLPGATIDARRIVAEKLSNGDENQVTLELENRYHVGVSLTVIDELPAQFQIRDLQFHITIPARKGTALSYSLRPVQRGEYEFGQIVVYATSTIGLVLRRIRIGAPQVTRVYPAFLQMRRFELLAISNQLTLAGLKKIRRLGHTMEFEHIREYVVGDDYRTVNWKATARRNEFMVNQHQDERSQQIFSIIDMGRVMKMPFGGMSLLDYAINSTLVISNIALKKGDRVGLLTLTKTINAQIPAERKGSQLSKIMEVLYNQQTNFQESNFELLFAAIRRRITQRSLLLLFTNFESLTSLHRQLPYLQQIAANHLLVVIFFQNTELCSIQREKATDVESVYVQTIAEKFSFEKKQIVRVLRQHGIHAVLTAPEDLSVNTINKYLELKARGMI